MPDAGKVFYRSLQEIKQHRDKPNYVAHELTQMLNSFEENPAALPPGAKGETDGK